MSTLNWLPFDGATVSSLPDTAGIYEISDGREVIYVGMSFHSVKERLQAQLREPWGTQSATQFRWAQCSEPQQVERQLLGAHWLLHGRLPRHNQRLG